MCRQAILLAFVVAALSLAVTTFDEPVELASAASNAAPSSSRPIPAPRGSIQVENPVAVWDSDFVAWVERKYQYLLADVLLTEAARMRLMQLLLEREHIAGLIDPRRRDGELAIVSIENELRELLPPAHYATFRLLKDSDDEQHHLLEYAGGISNTTPITAQQQRAVLEVKLRHKQAYDVALGQSGLERDTLSVAEREYAHGAIAAALSAYRKDYLQEVRQVLDEEQYVLLSNYETTEFNRELEQLQMAINAK